MILPSPLRAFAAAPEIHDNFLFDTKSSVVYVTLGETVAFPWVVAGADTAAPMRILDEIQTWNRSLSTDEFKTRAALWTVGDKPGARRTTSRSANARRAPLTTQGAELG